MLNFKLSLLFCAIFVLKFRVSLVKSAPHNSLLQLNWREQKNRHYEQQHKQSQKTGAARCKTGHTGGKLSS